MTTYQNYKIIQQVQFLQDLHILCNFKIVKWMIFAKEAHLSKEGCLVDDSCTTVIRHIAIRTNLECTGLFQLDIQKNN